MCMLESRVRVGVSVALVSRDEGWASGVVVEGKEEVREALPF